MGNVAELRYSKRLLDRAVCWAVDVSWADPSNFPQGQRDATNLRELTKALEELGKAAGSYKVLEQMGYRWLVESLRRVEELTVEHELEEA